MSEPTAVKVVFHDTVKEGVGPMRVVFEDDDPPVFGSDDPDRPRDEWVTRRHAQKVADAIGVPLEEV